MNRKLQAVFLVSIIWIWIFSMSVVFGGLDLSVEAIEDQTLYFQKWQENPVQWFMNTTMPSGQAMSKPLLSPTTIVFASLPLTDQFNFGIVNSTIYHEEVPTGSGNFTLRVTLGFLHFTGTSWQKNPRQTQSSNLTSGSNVNSITIDLNTLIFSGERLFAEITFTSAQALQLDMRWGNSTYPSRVSYDGTAIYVSEFPQLLVLPLFIMITLIAIIAFKKQLRQPKRA